MNPRMRGCLTLIVALVLFGCMLFVAFGVDS